MNRSQPSVSDSLESIGAILSETGAKRIFFVVDEAASRASGANERLADYLRNAAVHRFTQFELNPKLEDVQRGIDEYRQFQPDVVVALGGGTAIDLAKLIGSMAVQPHTARDIAIGNHPIELPGVPFVVVPTTSGTGSEATHFAVVYVDGVKYSVADASLLPSYAVVDSTLTESLPKSISAATGLDAFCQAIESLWSVGATDGSIAYATEAAKLAFENLAIAANDANSESRRAMSRAAHLAGKAINITKTTAPHALSYAITSKNHTPHGMAVAVTLAPILVYNAGVTDNDCTDPRGADHVLSRIDGIVQLLGAEDVDDACSSILELLRRINCPVSLADVGVTTHDALIEIVQSVNAERLSNNPRRASSDDLIQLLTPCITGASGVNA